MFFGRVQVVPEVFPMKDGAIVDCIPSFSGQPAVLDESKFTAVSYLVHQGRRLPLEVWPDIAESDLAKVAAKILSTPSAVHNRTRYPVQTAGEILVATDQEIHRGR
jgi:hypothetical protein